MDAVQQAVRTNVAKPVTGSGTSPHARPLRLLLVGGDSALRASLPAGLPEFQVVLAATDVDPRAGLPAGHFDLCVAALPMDPGARMVLEAFRARASAPVVTLVGPADAPLARALDPKATEVVVLRRGQPATELRLSLLGHALRGRGATASAGLGDLLEDSILEFDAGCRVLAANLAACNAAGRDRRDVLGLRCSDVLPADESCASGHCAIEEAVRTGSDVRLERARVAAVVQVSVTPVPGAAGSAFLYRESDVTGLRRLEHRLAGSLASLEAAHAELAQRAERLERIAEASTELKSAATREELADRVLKVLADLPGFGLVAVGLQDQERGVTQMSGVALMAGGLRVPLGRRTVLLDLLNLSPERRRVSSSHVIEGLSISIHGSPDTWGPRTALGEWDLAEVFDGTAVALTPVRATGRTHAFLLVKAAAAGTAIDAESLRVVEILAHLAAVGFDNLRLVEAERRRAAVMGMVSRLGRTLIDVHDPDRVLAMSAHALRSVLDGAAVAVERFRDRDTRAPAGPLSGPHVLRSREEAPPATGWLAVPAAQLVVPVRAGQRLAAVMYATSPLASAFDGLDLGALEVFGKAVGKALANADAFVEEQQGMARLEMIAEVGRIAGSSLQMEDVLARTLVHLCQKGPCELAAVGLVDAARGKLVLRAQASRTGARIVEGLCTRLTDGITGAVATSGQPLLVPDVSREPRYLEADPSVRSELCLPLRAQGVVVGVLDLESTRPGAFDERDVVAFTSVADHLAHALRNARLYREVNETNLELRESERKKTEFLSIVAHDLRTPLTSIRSAADVVLMYRDEPPEVTDEFLRSIRDEAARLGRLVDDFLAHSRMEAGMMDYDVAELDLGESIERFCRVFEGPASQKGLTLERQIPAGLPAVLADSERLAQVLSNLLSNATRCTPPGGRVSVTATVLPAREGQVLGKIRVDVSDTGPGIEESDREKVFAKFVRLDGSAGGGAGLGLPIARAIVEHLGGRMWVEPSRGGGAMFSFTLPARLDGLGMRR